MHAKEFLIRVTGKQTVITAYLAHDTDAVSKCTDNTRMCDKLGSVPCLVMSFHELLPLNVQIILGARDIT